MVTEPAKTARELRIGAVSYLNSKPLVYELESAIPEASVSYDLPSRLADALIAGSLDVALVPIVEYLRHPEFDLVSTACVACVGPVLSVKLYLRTPPQEVKRLALDEGSRTSAALARVLLSKLYHVTPELARLPIGNRLTESDADAVLLIGDRAMQPPGEQFQEVWDLGEKWSQWTNLPFVFAAWVARPDLPIQRRRLGKSLESVRNRGLKAVDSIVQSEAGRLGLPGEVAYAYLTRNLHFNLGPDERRGMHKFASYCRELGLLNGNFPSFTLAPTLDDCSTT